MEGTQGTQANDSPGIEQIQAFIARRDVPCPVCGYSLRGLAGDTCPECGAPLELQVGSPQLRVGGWVLAIVAFALALGFDGVVALLMAWQIIVTSFSRGAVHWQVWGVATIFVALALAMLGCLVWIARAKTAWQRRPVASQWLRGGLCIATVGGLHLVLGAGIAGAFII